MGGGSAARVAGEVGGAVRTSMKEEVPDCATVPSWLIRSSLDMPADVSQGWGQVKVGEGGRPAASGCGCVLGGPLS